MVPEAAPFTFENFSFNLPTEYYSEQMGDFKYASALQINKIRNFLQKQFPQL
jgi:hypothetical protein